jgi:hypothetical protein
MSMEPANRLTKDFGSVLRSEQPILFDRVSSAVLYGGRDLLSNDLAELANRELHNHFVFGVG